MSKFLTSAAIAVGAAFMLAPANAQVGVDLGLDTDVDLKVDPGVELRVGDPYTYRGYRSGRWYYSDYDRSYTYYDRYGGYDCHQGFRYTWHDDYRARYEAYWCFDDDGRRYEVDRTRTVVRID